MQLNPPSTHNCVNTHIAVRWDIAVGYHMQKLYKALDLQI